jgi:hypothetical protein
LPNAAVIKDAKLAGSNGRQAVVMSFFFLGFQYPVGFSSSVVQS